MARFLKFFVCLVVAGVCLIAGCNPPYDNFLRHEGLPHNASGMSVVQLSD